MPSALLSETGKESFLRASLLFLPLLFFRQREEACRHKRNRETDSLTLRLPAPRQNHRSRANHP